jgi:hypothetical protein
MQWFTEGAPFESTSPTRPIRTTRSITEKRGQLSKFSKTRLRRPLAADAIQ